MSYYVYAYIRDSSAVDGVPGTPYYIGKGQGRRVVGDHGKVKIPLDKNFIIKLETNLTEIGAYALERRLISWWGRKIDGGILDNLSPGGQGGIGHNKETAAKAMRTKRANNTQHKTTGKATAKSPVTGEIFHVSVTDPRWATGEIVGIQRGVSIGPMTAEHRAKIAKSRLGKPRPESVSKRLSELYTGTVLAKCAVTGEYVGRVLKTDPRWKTGEIVSIQKGKQHLKKKVCPHCGVEITVQNIKRHLATHT